MTVRYDYLDKIPFDQAHAVMVEAFADYQVDMSYMTRERSWLRNLKSGVQYHCSVGAFDRDRLVGLTFVGIDQWRGELAAFDAGTGIIPAFRGQGVARGMFEFVLPRLKEQGVSLFLLEVLQDNHAAIRAYQKTGFGITREFYCYDLPPQNLVIRKHDASQLDIRVVERQQITEFEPYADWQPSWENSFSGMQRIEDEMIRLGAFIDGRCVGVVVFYPLLQWIMSLVVVPQFRRHGVASALLSALVSRLPKGVDTIKINNIDKADQTMKVFFEKVGAHWVIDQYEMEYRFTT